MGAFGHHFLFWLVTGGSSHRFFREAVSIGCSAIKSISIWKRIIRIFFLRVRVRHFFWKMRFVGCIAHKRSLIRSPLPVFYANWVLRHLLSGELRFVLWLCFKRNLSVFFLYTRDELFSHLRLLSGIMSLIGGTDCAIRLIRFGFYDDNFATFRWRLLPGIDGMLMEIVLIWWNFPKRKLSLQLNIRNTSWWGHRCFPQEQVWQTHFAWYCSISRFCAMAFIF